MTVATGEGAVGSMRLRLVVAWLGVVAIAILGQLRIWPLFAEDGFIALRYAQNLVEGHGLVWSPGERVEGYSMLLWILLCSGPIALGIDPVLAARGLGVLWYAIAIAALLRLWPPRAWAALPASLIAPASLVVSATGATWMMGGLEEPLVAALLATAIAAFAAFCARPASAGVGTAGAAGLPFGLLCLARSEGPVWLLMPVLVLALSPRRRLVPAFVLPALLCVLGQLAFRLGYYGEWLPNTAWLKVNPSAAVLHEGLRYLGGALWSARGIVPLAAIGVLVGLCRRERRVPVLLLLVPLLGWCAYLALIGGDYFPSHRRFVPVIVLLGLLAAEALQWLARRPAGGAVAGLLAAASVGALGYDFAHDPSAVGLRDAAMEWRNVEFGKAIGAAFRGSDPLVAVDAAGGIPYGSRLRHLDMMGFNDPVVARTPISAFAWQAVRQVLHRDYVPGHMHGNGGYVLDREPDLVLFNSAPCFLLPPFASGNEMQEDVRWRDGYRAVRLQCPTWTLPTGAIETQRATAWVRLSGRLGVRREGEATVVPGLLIGSYRQPQPFRMLTPPAPGSPERGPFERDLTAALQWESGTPVVAVLGDGQVAAEFTRAGEGVCDGIELAAGRYRIDIEPPAVPLAVRIERDGVVLGDRERGFALAQASTLRVVAAVAVGTAVPCRVQAIRLLRLP